MAPLLSGLALLLASINRIRKSGTTIWPFRGARRLVTDGTFNTRETLAPESREEYVDEDEFLMAL